MSTKNKIFIIGNGFDIAHNFKTKFSDFAYYYLEKKIVPSLINCIKNKNREHPLFRTEYLSPLVGKFSNNFGKTPEDILWDLGQGEESENLISYITNNFNILESLIKNSLLARLYNGKDKNWFDVENIYFQELIPIKDKVLKKAKLNNDINLQNLNIEFFEIKSAVTEYLNTLEITHNEEIENFFNKVLKQSDFGYFINFNYTTSVKNYIHDSEKLIVNHIHGSLKENNIIFGYGNDQNDHYQEMKESEIDDFLTFFKTFDYLQDSNYDRVYSEALDVIDEYDVYVLGHSLGMTDKTLLSEIFNNGKCKKIHLFKRSDLKGEISVRFEFRKLNYAASRILTNEKDLRKKLVNYNKSNFFPI